MLTQEQIEEEFSFILGRRPENDLIYEHYGNLSDKQALRDILLTSGEFMRRYIDLSSITGPCYDDFTPDESQTDYVFRSIMGRAPGDVSYLRSNFQTLGEMRQHLLDGPECRRKQALRRQAKLARGLGDTDLGFVFKSFETSGDFVEDSLFNDYLRRLNPGSIIVDSPGLALGWIVAQIKAVSADHIKYYIGARPNQKESAPSQRHSIESTKAECAYFDLRVDLLGDLLLLHGVLPDLVILDAPRADCESIVRIFDSLSDKGAVVIVGDKEVCNSEVIKAGLRLKREVLHTENAMLIQRNFWFFSRYQRVIATPNNIKNERYRAKLALAFIMKDESQVVCEMLESVVHLCGFVACRDTGSSDGSQALVRHFLDSKGADYLISESPFSFFDAERNAAIEMVPPSFDWILMLDADERIDAKDYEALWNLLDQDRYDAWAIARNNWHDVEMREASCIYPDRQVRLFRNRNCIRYSGRVHEGLTGYEMIGSTDLSPIGEADDRCLHIQHFGFRNQYKNDAKQQLYKQLGA